MRVGSPRGRRVRGGPERSNRGAGGQVQKKRRGQPRGDHAREAPEAAPRGVAAAPARQPVAGRAATNDAANLNDVVGLFAWPKKPRTVWAAAKAAITGQPEAPRTFHARRPSGPLHRQI